MFEFCVDNFYLSFIFVDTILLLASVEYLGILIRLHLAKTFGTDHLYDIQMGQRQTRDRLQL